MEILCENIWILILFVLLRNFFSHGGGFIVGDVNSHQWLRTIVCIHKNTKSVENILVKDKLNGSS